jgi:hypothetical protein
MGDGNGVIQMPVLYKHGSYQELERCLVEMRETHRQERWHLMQRYVWGDPRKRLIVQSRKTRQGRVPMLPPNAELRIQHETLNKGLMVVYCYTWADEVDPRLVERGIAILTSKMYGGDTSRLELPKPFLDRLLGVSDEQPRPRHLPRHPLLAS